MKYNVLLCGQVNDLIDGAKGSISVREVRTEEGWSGEGELTQVVADALRFFVCPLDVSTVSCEAYSNGDGSSIRREVKKNVCINAD